MFTPASAPAAPVAPAARVNSTGGFGAPIVRMGTWPTEGWKPGADAVSFQLPARRPMIEKRPLSSVVAVNDGGDAAGFSADHGGALQRLALVVLHQPADATRLGHHGKCAEQHDHQGRERQLQTFTHRSVSPWKSGKPSKYMLAPTVMAMPYTRRPAAGAVWPPCVWTPWQPPGAAGAGRGAARRGIDLARLAGIDEVVERGHRRPAVARAPSSSSAAATRSSTRRRSASAPSPRWPSR